ncbi:MAG TPA: glycosyltransferase [Bosea sp. (in: a-proteobacteria)]|jgi:predicted glycosyltransferase|uniref:glycosyltransferase family protein n=1 Tax=Bosea sp. (in: a-proteobacteria) TaxID=1871050 RepID=UPI002E0D7F5C|nr:glycosyltransferase [Bosea sp. (in: a-proteobacteria)]
MTGQVLIAVTHLLGVGHLVRARHLAAALAQAGYAVTLASGGMPDGKVASGYRFVQLSPVRVEGTDFRNLLDEAGEPAAPERLTARVAGLATLARELRPDVVITEHFPFGRRQLAGEFLELIEAVRATRPDCLLLSSIRDVLVAPQRADRLAEAERRIVALFDGVLVHGDRGFLPLEASWPVTPAIAERLHYTGYLAAPAASTSEQEENGEILVSGGGSAAALPLFRLALATAGLLPGRRWRILVGQGVSETEFAGLVRQAPGNAMVERARPDFPILLGRCALSLSLAGYNTVLDLVQARRPALVTPFDAGNETEQAIRAAALERAGLARAIRPEAGPEALAAAIAGALEAGRPAPLAVALDGAAGTVAAIARLRARSP